MKQFSKDLGNVSLAPKGKWSREQEYEKLALVYNACDNLSYIAKINVPSGVDIENREYWQPMNATGYADNNFINLTAENENGTITAYETLEEAVATILPINRRAGATLSFYNLNSDRLDRQAEFELWQFNSTDLANWENRDYWNNVYYNWNVFVGWYIGTDALKNHIKLPTVGQYAYVGSNLNDAVLYQCRTNGIWTNTGTKIRNYISVVVGGNISIGNNGNWFNNGEDTGIPATPAVDERLDNIGLQLQQYTTEIIKLRKNDELIKNDINSNFETINNKVDKIKVDTDNKIDDANNNLQEQITGNHNNIDTLNTKHESLSKTVQGIAVTGGASTATNVTYNKTNSKLNAENAQDAIDELQTNKFDKSSIEDTIGEEQDKVMSQKAVFNTLYNDKIPTDSIKVNQFIAILKLYQNIVPSTENLYKFQVEIDDSGNIKLIRFWNGVDKTHTIFYGNAPANELNYKVFYNSYFTIVLRNLEKLGTKKRSYLIPVNYIRDTGINDTINISYHNTTQTLEVVNYLNTKIDIIESDLDYFDIKNNDNTVYRILGPNYPTLYFKNANIKNIILPFTNKKQKIKYKINNFNDVEYKYWLSNLIVYMNNFSNVIKKIVIRKFEYNDAVGIQTYIYDEEGNTLVAAKYDRVIKEVVDINIKSLNNFNMGINSSLIPKTNKVNNYLLITIDSEDLPYNLKVNNNIETDLRNVNYFPSNVLQQNYYDDNLIEKKGQLLRTDTIIVNQGNIGSLYNQRNYEFKVIGDDSSNVEYKYFSWLDVQTTSGIYDFTGIEKFLKSNYSHHNRSILRLFPSCLGGSTSVTYNGKKLNFPTYIADIMTSENAQFAEYNGYWLLDINCEGVYTEYSKLMQEFGKWLDSTIIDEGKNIKAKDVILYIDFGLLGPWGEGGWYNLQMTTTTEKLVRYVKDFATYVPDIQINIGLSLVNDNKGKYWNRNEFVIQSKEIKNNVGYIGMFIDNYGSALELVFKPNMQVSRYYTMRMLINKYVQRGDFFTGEFAGWQDNSYWGGNDFLNTYNSFLLFKQPYIRIHNMSITTNKGTYSIKKISPQTYYVLNNVLSCVGFRYVLSILHTDKKTNSVNIEWELTNIGLNKCFFNIYELYYRVHNTDDTVIDTKINYDLRTLKPWNDIPLLFAIGNGKYFNTEIPITDKTKDISLIIKDIKDIQSPLYLSNYGRLEDGSYLLWKNN